MKNEPNDWHGQNCLTFLKDQVAFCITKTKTGKESDSCFFTPSMNCFSPFENIHNIMETSLRISLDLVSGTGMTGIVSRQPGNEFDHHRDEQMMIIDQDHKNDNCLYDENDYYEDVN